MNTKIGKKLSLILSWSVAFSLGSKDFINLFIKKYSKVVRAEPYNHVEHLRLLAYSYQ